MMETEFLSTTGDDIYEVEKIIKKRHHPSKGIQYFVKWRHFPTSDNTWEPARNFSQKLIDDYESSHRNKKHKPSPSKVNTKSFPRRTATTTTATAQLETPPTSSSDHLMPSSSSSLTSSCSSSATIVSSSSGSSTNSESPQRFVKSRAPKFSSRRRQQQALRLHVQQQKQQQSSSINGQQLAVFNPVDGHSSPVAEEVVYEPKLTNEPIIVTDVTAKDLTVTISECKTPDGFFST